MQPVIRPLRKTKPPVPQSWSSLVATTLGLDDFGRLRTVVSGRVPHLENCRLIVQSYAASAMTGGLPGLYARPLAAAQRAVTAEDLVRGIDIVLFNSGGDPRSYEGCAVIAWVEPGHPDLDYDGLCARPTGAVFVGTARASSDRAAVVLERAAA